MHSEYTPTIGLEIHVELKTATKLFSRSKNDPDEKEPNVNVSPVDLAHPGTLPVLNKEAVKHVLKVGLALGSHLADYTEWDRKNYFYPDIPKAYQISQYKHPLVQGGSLAGVAITRIHLEEDTGRSLHDKGDYSLVDYNRAGVPLMEMVTEPVIHSAEEAGAFARELQLLLRTLGVSDANMEKGEMRLEVNISLSNTDRLGTKVEVKNINSFKAMERAIQYEISRHKAILEAGKSLIQETRGWDEHAGETFSQRSKEDAHDYRYFPDPDIPKLWISEMPEFDINHLRTEMPELPSMTRSRFAADYGLKEDTIEVLLLDPRMKDLFERSAAALPSQPGGYQLLANYIVSDLVGLIASDEEGSVSHIDPTSLSSMIVLIQKNTLSSRGAKEVLATLYKQGGDALTIATEKGLLQQNDEAFLEGVVQRVIDENPGPVGQIRDGKIETIQFLVGQGMKLSRGSANPGLLRSLIEKALDLP